MNWNHEAHTDLALALSEVGNLDDCLGFFTLDRTKIPPSLLKAKFVADRLLSAERKIDPLLESGSSNGC